MGADRQDSSLGILSRVPVMQAIDLQAVIQCTSLTSAATRNAAALLLSKLASLRPKTTLEVTLQVAFLCVVPLLPQATSLRAVLSFHLNAIGAGVALLS